MLLSFDELIHRRDRDTERIRGHMASPYSFTHLCKFKTLVTSFHDTQPFDIALRQKQFRENGENKFTPLSLAQLEQDARLLSNTYFYPADSVGATQRPTLLMIT